MSWRLYVVGVLALSLSGAAWGQVGCDNLTIAQSEKFVEHFSEGYAHFQNQQFDDAIAEFEIARSICAYDPAVTYVIARSVQGQGQCKAAISLFKQAENFRASSTPDDDSLEAKIAEYQEKAEGECKLGRYSVDCAQDEVELRIDGGEAQPCPLGNTSAPPGTYVLVASLEGHIDYELELEIVAGEPVRFTVPKLEEFKANEGILSLKCPEEIGAVELYTEDGTKKTVLCPSQQPLVPGTYTVKIPGKEIGQTVPVVKGETTPLEVRDQVVEEEKIGLFFGLRGAAGTGYVGARPLFDKNGENEVSSLTDADAPQPTLLTGALTNEIGFYFLDYLGAGVRLRFSFPNFSITGEAFARFIPWHNDFVGLRADVGFGGGEILAAFQFSGGNDTCATAACIARLDAVFASVALGLDVRLSSIFSIVLLSEARLFLPDLALHFDFASLGLEVQF